MNVMASQPLDVYVITSVYYDREFGADHRVVAVFRDHSLAVEHAQKLGYRHPDETYEVITKELQ